MSASDLNPLDRYARLCSDVFGGVVAFDITGKSNNVLDALRRSDGNYQTFSTNFEQRLRRLHALEGVAKIANRIARSEWDGAYGELSALDYFLHGLQISASNILLDQTVPASHTLASEMGMQEANFDLVLTNFGIALDVKLLSDKTRSILEGIFSDFRRQRKIDRLTILPAFDPDLPYELFEQNRQSLLKELCTKAVVDNPRVVSDVIPGLSYELGWNPSVLSSVNSYSPTEHANNHHRLLFTHAKKFLKTGPSVIVFSIFPWFSESCVWAFEDSKHQFSASLEHSFSQGI